MNSGILEAELSRSAASKLEKIWGAQLSRRELEVGGLAIDGYSTQQIAERLFISENTVKTHLRNLFRKTKTRSRNELYRQIVESSLKPATTAGTTGQVISSGCSELDRMFAGDQPPSKMVAAVLRLRPKQQEQAPQLSPGMLLDLVATSIRLGDHFFHWRDELYLLALPGGEPENASEVADRLIRKVRRWASMKGLDLEVGMGMATLEEGHGTAAGLLETAHSRLRRVVGIATE